MAAAITAGITSAIGAVGDVISAIFGTDGTWAAILPVIGLGVGVFVIGFAIRTIKNLIQGY